jgi:hypothetical protein
MPLRPVTLSVPPEKLLPHVVVEPGPGPPKASPPLSTQTYTPLSELPVGSPRLKKMMRQLGWLGKRMLVRCGLALMTVRSV